MQKGIGISDVKSFLVVSYAKKNSKLSTQGIPIPFELERLNIGGAMNGKTGKFKASARIGVYFFAFNGIAVITTAEGGMNVALMVNGKEVGRAQRKSHVGNEWETLALQSTMDLKAMGSSLVANYRIELVFFSMTKVTI